MGFEERDPQQRRFGSVIESERNPCSSRARQVSQAVLEDFTVMTAVLVLNRLSQARDAGTFHEFWSHVGNDQWADWGLLFHEATDWSLPGVPVPAQAVDDEQWTALRALVQAAAAAVEKMNEHLKDADPAVRESVCDAAQRFKDAADREDRGDVYRTVAESIFNTVLIWATLGRKAAGLGESRLFDVIQLQPPPVLDSTPYDVFVSYKTRRHADRAHQLATYLKAQGYAVWFDEFVLGKRADRAVPWDHAHLETMLRNAVEHSRCTVVFEATLHSVVPGPGRTAADVVSDGHGMIGPGGDLVSRDWHVVEVMATQRGLAIHPNKVAVFDIAAGKEARFLACEREEDVAATVRKGLTLLGIEPPDASPQPA
jgi:hypothetical protein